ncbi:FAD-binding protein [Amycolatopsis pigmentata]|uniref:FAD-binding protein n=1 Tax=Amycolatopsis pigmentata TaxID=450801 RepID=A0ABW5FLJ5_9PSEU
MARTGVPAVNWAGNVTFGAERVYRPESVDEVRGIVAGSRRVRALGSGHSFNRVADTEHDLVRLDRLRPTAEIDPDAATVTVAGGMRYADLVFPLHRAGFALANLASLPHISIAGSCATATHGSGDGLRCLAAAVSGLQLVGPEGDLVEVGRETEGFAGSVVALGALGVVTSMTLDIEPAYEMAQRVHLGVPLAEVAGGIDEVFGAAYSVSLFTDWRSGHGDVWLKRRIGEPETGWDGGRRAREKIHPVPGMPVEASTEQLDVVGPWHERLPHFRPELQPGPGDELQSEFFLPRAAAPEAFAAIREVGELVAPVLHIAEVRTVRGDDLWLSPAYRRDTVAFHFTWIGDIQAVQPALAAVEQRLVPLGSRPHWGKLTTLTPSETIGHYERAGDFERLLREHDPEGKFRNAFVDELF